MSKNDVLELKNMVKELQNDIKKIDNQMASMQKTVDLLVEGKIRITNNNGSSKSDEGMTKITMATIEIARMAIAALTGYLAGKGG